MAVTPILQTQRLILRPVSLEDAPAIQKHFNNWNIIKRLSTAVPWPYPDDGAETFIRENVLPRVGSGKAHVWGIIPKDGPDEVCGIIDYREENQADGGNRGFWLSEDLWGRGLMTEAVTAVQDYLFFELGIEKLQVVNAMDNVGSHRVKEKTGAEFVKYGTLPHNSGEDRSEIWVVTKDRWKELRGRSG